MSEESLTLVVESLEIIDERKRSLLMEEVCDSAERLIADFDVEFKRATLRDNIKDLTEKLKKLNGWTGKITAPNLMSKLTPRCEN